MQKEKDIEIKPIKEKKVWESFLLSQSITPFFQSWNWGIVQELEGTKIERLGIFADQNLLGICQVEQKSGRRGNFFHIRQGPVFRNWSDALFKILHRELVKLAKERQLDFTRIGPPLESRTHHQTQKIFNILGYIPRVISNQDAEKCITIDTSQDIKDIEKGMRKNTRYYIRKAKKMGLETHIITTPGKELEDFIEFYKKSAKQIGYIPHGGIENEFRILAKDKQIALINISYNDEILSSGLFIFYGKEAVYHHSANSYKHPNIPASYLMIYEAIKETKRRGIRSLNLWGVVGPNERKHPWYGFSQFKRGFSKHERSYIHGMDYPISWRYKFIRLYERLEKYKKGY